MFSMLTLDNNNKKKCINGKIEEKAVYRLSLSYNIIDIKCNARCSKWKVLNDNITERVRHYFNLRTG